MRRADLPQRIKVTATWYVDPDPESPGIARQALSIVEYGEEAAPDLGLPEELTAHIEYRYDVDLWRTPDTYGRGEIICVEQGVDRFVVWSHIADGMTGVDDAAGLFANGVEAGRIVRAREVGSSMLNGGCRWDATGLVVQGRWWLPRENLVRYVNLFEALDDDTDLDTQAVVCGIIIETEYDEDDSE